MSTVAVMVTNVQANAPSLSLVRDSILKDLNDALQDLMEEADLEATTGTGLDATAIVTVAAQQSYALPSNCVKPLDLSWRLGGILAPVDYVQRDVYRRISQVSNGESPVTGAIKWNVWANKFWLWPIPTDAGSAGGDGELVMDYYKNPAALVNDADVPDIPAQYHNLLEQWATSQAYVKSDEGQWAVYWKGLFNEGKRQMNMERATTQRAMPAKIRPARW